MDAPPEDAERLCISARDNRWVDLTPFNFGRRREVAVIVGAGATRGAHFVAPGTVCKPPLDGDFFTLLRSSGLAADPGFHRLLEFVEREFGSLRVGMEAFYSQASLYDRFIRDIPIGGKGRRREYRSNLTYFQRVLPRLFATSLAGQVCRFHEALATVAQPGDCFISFNYDCLLDRAVKAQGGRRWSAATGYGFPVGGDMAAWQDHSGRGRMPTRAVRILKPHGSLNWGRRNDAINLLPDEYASRAVEELVIVPPLWQKSFDEEPYQTIWQETRRTLSSVKALLVIGYSLPETDVYTQATLRMDVQELDFLCVVNPDKDARDRISRVLRSAITTSTHVVEFEWLRDLAAVLPPPRVGTAPAP